MKISFDVPAVIKISGYHAISDIQYILRKLGIKGVGVKEETVEDSGYYYAIVYKKGHRPTRREVVKMIDEYEGVENEEAKD